MLAGLGCSLELHILVTKDPLDKHCKISCLLRCVSIVLALISAIYYFENLLIKIKKL